jgi:D-alanyl-D-alanine carboxypeptidase/D-alanyl-D-alanine-endopeptidase (penicillin-binding protein 4)
MSIVTSSASGGRHRKPKSGSPVVRRALVVAAAAPVAVGVMAGQSAFAAEPGAASQSVSALDSFDHQMAKNLDARVQNAAFKGSTFSGLVIDAASGQTVWNHDASTALMPASNAKLATATAALTILGPNHRFTTKAVYSRGVVTLVGGGDRVLSTSDLTAMAKSVVAQLKKSGVKAVKVQVDDSLFPAPTLAEGWPADYYTDVIPPVRALSVDEDFSSDTSVDAGQVFAKQLTAQGLHVTGGVARGKAHSWDVSLAVHQSPTVSAVVHQMLKTSDAQIAESLLRMTALAAGHPATYQGGDAVVKQVLQHYGISLAGFQLYDGSGLSRDDRLTAETVAQILETDSESRYRAVLQPVIDGLPVAGEAGATLSTADGRFTTPESKCAVGKVMAKTGTLTGAVALSGLTRGSDGRWKIFSFIENGSVAATMDIRHAQDGLAATVNGCWA